MFVLPAEIKIFAGQIDLTGIAGREQELAGASLCGFKVAEETSNVVLDAKWDFAPNKAPPELRHGYVDKRVLGTRVAGFLPQLLAMSRDYQRKRPFHSTRGLFDLRQAVEFPGCGCAPKFQGALPELFE